METKLEICNFALLLSGAQTLQELAPANDTRVIGCNTLFNIVLNSELRKHNWNFATELKTIAADPTAPDFGYACRYKLPANYIKTQKMNNDLSIKWRRVGQYLHTDETTCQLEYTKKIENYAELDPVFIEAFGTKLAIYLGKKVTGANEAVIVNLWKMYKDIVAEARLADFRESGLETIEGSRVIDGRL